MKYPTTIELDQIYADREAALLALAEKDQITSANLTALDRAGRVRVANELWRKCDRSARTALINDEHPHVRSCAAIAATTYPSQGRA